MAERKLTEKQKQFCSLCAAGMEPKEAAKLLKYRDQGMWRKLMGMEKIQKEIRRLSQNKAEPMEKPTQKAEDEAPVAEKEEILCFLTEMMREDDDPKLRMKAAELLGKRESLFEKEKKPEEKRRIIIVDDLP